jgi:hypothetical protein
MRSHWTRVVGRRLGRLTVVTVVLLAAAAGIAYATIPDSNNVYNACELKGVGTVRLIDASLPPGSLLSHCTKWETPISWNQQGVKGDTGLQGPQGVKGDTGPQGPQGVKGDAGADGGPGAQGPQGPQGAKGDTGAMGPAGSGLAKVIRGGTYGQEPPGPGVYAGSGFTIVRNSIGNYTITFPAGTWSCYPIATFQSFFGGHQATIPFASGDGLVWTVDFGGTNTVFDFIFVDSC